MLSLWHVVCSVLAHHNAFKLILHSLNPTKRTALNPLCVLHISLYTAAKFPDKRKT